MAEKFVKDKEQLKEIYEFYNRINTEYENLIDDFYIYSRFIIDKLTLLMECFYNRFEESAKVGDIIINPYLYYDKISDAIFSDGLLPAIGNAKQNVNQMAMGAKIELDNENMSLDAKVLRLITEKRLEKMKFNDKINDLKLQKFEYKHCGKQSIVTDSNKIYDLAKISEEFEGLYSQLYEIYGRVVGRGLHYIYKDIKEHMYDHQGNEKLETVIALNPNFKFNPMKDFRQIALKAYEFNIVKDAKEKFSKLSDGLYKEYAYNVFKEK